MEPFEQNQSDSISGPKKDGTEMEYSQGKIPAAGLPGLSFSPEAHPYVGEPIQKLVGHVTGNVHNERRVRRWVKHLRAAPTTVLTCNWPVWLNKITAVLIVDLDSLSDLSLRQLLSDLPELPRVARVGIYGAALEAALRARLVDRGIIVERRLCKRLIDRLFS